MPFAAKNLRSIVYNLLSTNLKYRSPDRMPRVDVRAHVRLGHTVLEVHDNGLGLAPHQLARLLGMFRRFHDHVEGTGIGLYMVKRMVENAGSASRCTASPGRAPRFSSFCPTRPALVRRVSRSYSCLSPWLLSPASCSSTTTPLLDHAHPGLARLLRASIG